MQRLVTSLAFVVVASVVAQTQPKDGDIILSLLHNQTWAQGGIVYFDPTAPTLRTMATNVSQSAFSEFLQMGSNNDDVVVFEVHSSFIQGGWLVRIDKNGVGTTMARVPLAVTGFDLDGDDTWLLAGPAFGATGNTLYGVDDASGTLRTFFSYTPIGPAAHAGMAIVRESFPYATVSINFQPVPSLKVAGVSRSGIVNTLMHGASEPLQFLSGVALDPFTGDLITTDFRGRYSSPREPNGGTEVSRFNPRTGQTTPIAGFSGANAVKVRQDYTAFVAGHVLKTNFRVNAVMHIDLASNTVTSIYEFPGLSAPPWGFTSVDVYGSRVLTCNGRGGAGQVVNIALQSQRPRARNAFYRLAASFGRRPGAILPNGEHLHLNLGDPLFLLTLSDLVPSLTQNFSGRLSGTGSATASIRFPPGFPSNLGTTIFVAGVIFDQRGVVQATNTHWFEL